MFISIIIAVKNWQDNLEECVAKCLELDYPDFEVIVLPDDSLDSVLGSRFSVLAKHRTPNTEHRNREPLSKLRIIPTGIVNPAEKRDMALKYAQGDILAFIDDDAYPRKDWLKNAVRNFSDPEVAAVGGPGITPDNDSLKQKAGGITYASFLVSGNYGYRYLPKKRKDVDDYPSCNFLVRKTVMLELDGFNTAVWPGEDTKLCLDIAHKCNKKIIYDPGVLVYHHRRPLFSAHLRQIASYALHRGYFVKKYPQTSLRLAYFIPSIFLLFILFFPLSFIFILPLRNFYFATLSLYLSLAFICSIYNGLRLLPLVFFGIILTHLVYGFYFLKGIFSVKLIDFK